VRFVKNGKRRKNFLFVKRPFFPSMKTVIFLNCFQTTKQGPPPAAIKAAKQ